MNPIHSALHELVHLKQIKRMMEAGTATPHDAEKYENTKEAVWATAERALATVPELQASSCAFIQQFADQFAEGRAATGGEKFTDDDMDRLADFGAALVKELQGRLTPASARPLFVPNEAMLNAARDWSHEKFGKPIGNDAATGCWQAMYTALYGAAPVSTSGRSPAEDACVDIANDFDHEEIKSQTTSVRLAWDAGRKIVSATPFSKEKS